MDQTLTHRYVLRFEHTALHPRLHTEGFSLTCPHRTPTQGTSLRIWGNYNMEYTTPLSTKITSTLRGNAQPKHHLTQEGQALSHKTNNHLTLEGFQHNLHLSLEGAKHQTPPLTRGANHHSKINLYTRGIPQIRRVNNQVITKTTNNLFPQK